MCVSHRRFGTSRTCCTGVALMRATRRCGSGGTGSGQYLPQRSENNGAKAMFGLPGAVPALLRKTEPDPDAGWLASPESGRMPWRAVAGEPRRGRGLGLWCGRGRERPELRQEPDQPGLVIDQRSKGFARRFAKRGRAGPTIGTHGCGHHCISCADRAWRTQFPIRH